VTALPSQGRKVEFVCDRCLRSKKGTDLDPIPRCPRCLTAMEADSNEPIIRPQTARRLETLRRRKAEPLAPQAATAATKGKPRSSGGRRLDAL
jgi:hypothetical protein